MFSKVLCLLYLVAISKHDTKTYTVTDVSLISLFITVFCQDISKETSIKILEKVICGILFFSIFLAVAVKTGGLGAGDAKLAGVLGYSVGFLKTNLIFIVASVLGLIFFIYKKKILGKKIKKIAFVPFITIGYAVTEMLERKINAFI